MNDSEMVEEVVIALRRIVRSIDVHSHRLVRTCGLTGPQLVLMKEIGRRGTCTPSVLAQAAKVSNATVTGILRRLESRGFVRRRRSESDRRRFHVSLTESGQEALGAAPAMLQDKLGRALVGLKDWEQTLLLSSLQRLAEMMDADELDAAPILTGGALTLQEDQVEEVLAKPPPSEPEPTLPCEPGLENVSPLRTPKNDS